MAKKKTSKSTNAGPTFEESLEALQEIVTDLEGGQLGLSESLARYEEGVKHLKACQQLLDKAQRKIELLSDVDAEGNPITEPFDHQASGADEGSASGRGKRGGKTGRGRRRKGQSSDEIDDSGHLF